MTTNGKEKSKKENEKESDQEESQEESNKEESNKEESQEESQEEGQEEKIVERCNQKLAAPQWMTAGLTVTRQMEDSLVQRENLPFFYTRTVRIHPVTLHGLFSCNPHLTALYYPSNR